MRRPLRRRELPSGHIFEELLHFNFIPAPTVTVRLDALREVGGYDVDSVCEDYDLWLRLARRYEAACLEPPMVEYRLHDDNLHRHVADLHLGFYRAFRKHVDHPAGAARFVDHVREMARRGQIDERTRGDLQVLDVAGLDDWGNVREGLLGS